MKYPPEDCRGHGKPSELKLLPHLVRPAPKKPNRHERRRALKSVKKIPKRRMSIEHLGKLHTAVIKALRHGGDIDEGIDPAELESLTFGPTFAETLELNKANLDLYEENPKVTRLQPLSEVLS